MFDATKPAGHPMCLADPQPPTPALPPHLPCSMTPGGGLPLLVTVAVDAIELAHQVVLDRDMACQGQVVYTGGSSLDIRMELLQVCGGTGRGVSVLDHRQNRCIGLCW